MKKILLGVVVALIAVAGTGAGLYFSGFFQAPEVERVELRWGEVTPESTQVNGSVLINNRLPFGLSVSNFSLDAPMEIYSVPVGTLEVPRLPLRQGQSTVHAQGTIQQDTLPRWWPDFVRAGEILHVTVHPRGHADVLGKTFTLGLPSTDTKVSVPVLQNMKSEGPRRFGFDTTDPRAIGQDPMGHFTSGSEAPALPVLTMEAWDLRWGAVTQERSLVLGTIIMRNETQAPIPVQEVRLAFQMNDVEVIPETSAAPDPSVLPPGRSVPVEIEAMVDNARLVEWWTSHIQQGEETLATMRLGLTIGLPPSGDAVLGGVQGNLEAPLTPAPGFACRIRTDILGSASYRIAKELGTAEGEAPDTVDVQCGTRALVDAASG